MDNKDISEIFIDRFIGRLNESLDSEGEQASIQTGNIRRYSRKDLFLDRLVRREVVKGRIFNYGHYCNLFQPRGLGVLPFDESEKMGRAFIFKEYNMSYGIHYYGFSVRLDNRIVFKNGSIPRSWINIESYEGHFVHRDNERKDYIKKNGLWHRESLLEFMPTIWLFSR